MLPSDHENLSLLFFFVLFLFVCVSCSCVLFMIFVDGNWLRFFKLVAVNVCFSLLYLMFIFCLFLFILLFIPVNAKKNFWFGCIHFTKCLTQFKTKIYFKVLVKNIVLLLQCCLILYTWLRKHSLSLIKNLF